MPNGSTQNVEQAVRKVLGGVLSDVSDELRTSARGVNGARHALGAPEPPDEADDGGDDASALPPQVGAAVETLLRDLSSDQARTLASMFDAIAEQAQDGEPEDEPDDDDAEEDARPKAASSFTNLELRAYGGRESRRPDSSQGWHCRGDQTTQESRSSRLPGGGEGCQPRKKGVQQVGRQPLELQPGEVGNQELAFDDAVGARWTISRLTCLHGSGRSELQKRRSRFVIHESGERRGNGQQ